MECKRSLLLGLWITACALSPALAAPPTPPPPPIAVSGAWVRWLPGILPAGGYMTLKNTGTRTLVLTGVTSADFGAASLHRTIQRDGVSQMQAVSQAEIAPGSELKFATGGYHLMLEQPTRPIKPGDQVSITLHFSGGAATTALFDVRAPDAAP